jgi:hypothetical protein
MEHNFFFSGILSGFTSRFFISPFDVVKIKTQLGLIDNKKLFFGIADLYKKNGIKIFWQGNFISSISYSLYVGNQFWAYENSKKYFPDSPIINGINSGLFASISTYPFYAAKTRIMAQNNNIRYLTVDGLKKIRPRTIYDGFIISALGTIPSTVIRFVTYENLLPKFEDNKYKIEIVGGISGCLAQTVIMPLDNIEKKMQINRYYDELKKKNIIDTARTMYNNNGVKSFYRSFTPTIIKTTIASSLIFSMYNKIQKIL